MLTVFNCGQGDAMRLRCNPNKIPLYIDLGPSTFIRHSLEEKIDLMITHSHDDHIAGIFPLTTTTIDTLYLPAFLPEYLKILNKLGGISSPIRRLKYNRVELLWEGKGIAKHPNANIFNPPLVPEMIFSKKADIIDAREIDEYLANFETSVDDILATEIGLTCEDYPIAGVAERFVRAVIHKVKEYSLTEIDFALSKFDKYDANNLSIVFKYSHSKKCTFLFTGDATKRVFNRIIKTGTPIYADILKTPHHGSKHSLNMNILRKINPKIAITSHGNKPFGTAKTKHPHEGILDLFAKYSGLNDYYTNDVKRNSKLLRSQTIGSIPHWPVEIMQ